MVSTPEPPKHAAMRPVLRALVCMACGVTLSIAHQNPPRTIAAQEPPSVFVVEVTDKFGAVVAGGSAVALGPDKVVTNCHVANSGISLRILQNSQSWPAEVVHRDADRDICGLKIENLRATPVRIRNSATVEVGERVYAVGAPKGLELTFNEGIISNMSMRDRGGDRVLQTTAPISHGSSGGGLFDAEGHLVGITTSQLKDSQNLNFAIPAEIATAGWIDTDPIRSTSRPELHEQQRSIRPEIDQKKIWLDDQSALMWSRQASKPVTWHQAAIYCSDFNLGGYTDWRLPTIEELDKLYVRGKSQISYPAVWSSDTVRGAPDAWVFMSNGRRYFYQVEGSGHEHALCVRHFEQ